MPLFQDSDRRCRSPWSGDHDHEPPARGSSKHLTTYEHDTPDYHNPLFPMEGPQADMELPQTNFWASDRQQLIHRIKESSPWRLQYRSQEQSHTNDLDMVEDSLEESNVNHTVYGQPCERRSASPVRGEIASPAEIQRPRSALHSGDFREGAAVPEPQSPRPRFAVPTPSSPFPALGTSPTTPWFEPSVLPTLPRRATAFSELRDHEPVLQTRSRAPSLGSFSSSYVLKAPTSPLVHQANNTDLDFSAVKSPGLIDKANRRRTLPPESFRHLQESPSAMRAVNIHSPSRERDMLFRPHHSPRRSLTSAYSLQLASTASISTYRARRLSFASETSSKPHAPMVGSYEESILRGRMSMNPSKPLDFTAQIGVLGKGKCKGHLKCPPHVMVPFPAVFYSYPTSGNGRSISDDSPSPYVGQIDLENLLPRDEQSTAKRRKRHYSPIVSPGEAARDETGSTRASETDTRRRREKKSRRAESPKCPPGGCYRIPQQGQLQIIIKNPHKTAVKLFLVPYDLSDMEPGTKTFIRQRSYSAGPIIDMPLSARKNFGTDRPEASLNTTENPQDKPTLRYLIHLNLCCPSRGRFYLYSDIRVVFANRVPDGKEKLRNEIQLPEPRYSPYKPSRESTISASASTSARLAIDQASRRRSAGHGTIPLLHPHISSPSDFPPHWTAPKDMTLNETNQTSDQAETTLYSKLNKGDLGYGGHLNSSGQTKLDTGESLLAKRLRGLDVHKPGSFDRN